MKNSENHGSETMKQTDSSRKKNGGVQSGSRFSTMSMVQVAIFGAIICIMACYPLSGLYPAWIYKGNDHPCAGHHRIAPDGTEKGRGAWISFRSDELYQ